MIHQLPRGTRLHPTGLFLGSFSSWQAARVEVKQEEQIETLDCTCRRDG